MAQRQAGLPVFQERGRWSGWLVALGVLAMLAGPAFGGVWTLYDSFDDNTLNTAIWKLNDGEGGPAPTEVGGGIPLAAGTSSSIRTDGTAGGNIIGFQAKLTHGTQPGDDVLIPLDKAGVMYTPKTVAISSLKVNGNNTSSTYTQNTLTFKATDALQYKVQAQTAAGGPLVDIVAATVLPAPDGKGVYTVSPVDIGAVVEIKGKRTIQVTTLNGTGGSSAAKVGITMLTPKIASLTPATGQFVGEAVAIKGSGFGPGDRAYGTVTFSGVPADVTSWSETLIVCTVPEGAVSGPVRVTSAEMPKPSERAYTVYPSPVGAWDLSYRIGTNRQGSVRFFIVKEAGRYFYLEDGEGVGEFKLAAGGKMTGKVYWFDQYGTAWDRAAEVNVSQCEVEDIDSWTLTFSKADTGKPSTLVARPGGKATATAQRDDSVDTSGWTWPLHQVQLSCEMDFPHAEARRNVYALVLVRQQTPGNAAQDAVLMSVNGNRELLLGQPEGLPANLPFSVWYGVSYGSELDLATGGEVLFAGDGFEIEVPVPALADPPLATGVTPLPGSLVAPGALDLGFSYDGQLPGSTIYGLCVEEMNLDDDVFATEQLLIGAGTIGGTVPAGILKSGKIYGVWIESNRANNTLNQACFDLELTSSFMVSSTPPDSRYSVYYSKSTSSGSAVLNDWWDFKDAKWVLLGANLSGVRTVTVPAGATVMRIQTNGRTLIDAVTRQDGRDMWFESYWEDYWDKIAFDQGRDDLRRVEDNCWYLLGNKTYVASIFREWNGADGGPLQQATEITITPGQD